VIHVVDYFTGAPVDATVTVDGSPAGTSLCLADGVHPIAVSASGYATHNDAIQVPGGAQSRTVQLVSVTPSLAHWLALVNSDRAANGAGALALDNGLMIAAWEHAADMGLVGYVSHWDPQGFAPTTRALMLGAMVMPAENVAAGTDTYVAAEQAFMAERSMLPNQSPNDCATNDDLAGHYCDLVWPSHNVLGLAIADVPQSPYVNYYDQEFGDLYAYYDTTVIGPEPKAGASAPLMLIPGPGQTFSSEFVQTMPAPTAISVATLNADPVCASACPAGDLVFPTGNTPLTATGPTAYTPTLSPGEIVFVELSTSVQTFFGAASVYAAFWESGTTTPTGYGASSVSYRVQ